MVMFFLNIIMHYAQFVCVAVVMNHVRSINRDQWDNLLLFNLLELQLFWKFKKFWKLLKSATFQLDKITHRGTENYSPCLTLKLYNFQGEFRFWRVLKTSKTFPLIGKNGWYRTFLTNKIIKTKRLSLNIE